MTFEEALKSMKDGKKVRRKCWENNAPCADVCMGLCEGNICWFDRKMKCTSLASLQLCCYDADDWEIYHEEQKHPEMDIEEIIENLNHAKLALALSDLKMVNLHSIFNSFDRINQAINSIETYSAKKELKQMKQEEKQSDETAVDTLLKFGHNIEIGKQESGDFYVKYLDSQVKDCMFLITAYGCGKTIHEACNDYLNKIKGKTLVFNAYSEFRKEEKFPVL